MLSLCHAFGLLLVARNVASHGPGLGQPAAALSMEGGGFRAFASDAGILAGLLAVRGRQLNMSHPSFVSTGILERFQSLSSVSGSSWFLAELLFSGKFLSLMEGIAASPATAAEQFRCDWTSPWLAATRVTASKFGLFEDIVRFIVKKLLGSGDEDTIYLAKYFLATGLTWDRFVDVLLNSTAGIEQDILLGSSAAPWSSNKIWLVDHSVVLPSKTKVARIVQGKLGFPQVSYTMESLKEPPTFLPAKFSISLGSGTSSKAPLPYISSSAVVGTGSFQYHSKSLFDSYTVSSGSVGVDLANGSINRFSGKLPLARAVAASSAFIGNAIVSGFWADELQALLDADVTPWVSAVSEGETFQAGREAVNALHHGVCRESVERLASVAVHAVIDGGFTEGTGLAQAVAAGAEEVLVVLNSYSVNDPSYVEQMFPGGPAPLNPGVPPELFPVFQHPNASYVGDAFEKFHKLQLDGSSTFLKVLAVGNFTAVTADNAYFGIAGGREVVITFVNVGSELSIGQFENLDHYNKLVQEIALTLTDSSNAEFVQNELIPKVLGPVPIHDAEIEAASLLI